MRFVLHYYSIGLLNRIARLALGTILICAAFSLPLTADWFAGLHLFATYPLLTALTAWDPFYSLFMELKQRFIDYHIFH